MPVLPLFARGQHLLLVGAKRSQSQVEIFPRQSVVKFGQNLAVESQQMNREY